MPGVVEPGPAPNAPADTSGRLRAIVAFICISTGIAVAARWDLPLGSAGMFGLACASLVVAALLRGAGCKAAMCATLVLFGAGVYTGRAVERPADDIVRLVRPGAGATALVELEGVVVTAPRRADAERRPDLAPNPGAWIFDFDLRSVGQRTASGRLSVIVRGRERPETEIGAVARIAGEYEPPRAPSSPGEPDRRRTQAVEGRSGALFVGNAALIEELRPAVRSGPILWRERIRARARSVLGLDDDPTDARRLIAALALGERGGGAAAELREPFARIGAAHMLAISGFHLVVMAGIGVWLLRLGRDRGWVEPAIIALLVLVYMLLVPARPPVVRAGVMALTLLAAEASGRRHDRVAVLAWTAIGLLVWRPIDLFSPGFRLSVGLTAALVWVGSLAAAAIAARLARKEPAATTPARWRWSGVRELSRALIGGPVAQALVMTLVCWFAGIGLIAHETGRFSPIGVFATLALLPFIVALLWFGLLAVLTGLVWEPAGRTAIGWLEAPATWGIELADWMSRLPFAAIYTPGPGLFGAIAIGVLACWLLAKPRRPLTWAASLCTVGTVLFAPALTSGVGARIRVDMIAVDDGSALLVRSGRGAVLWDAGSLSAGAGRWTIGPALRELGVWRLDAVVVSHPNLDHYNAIAGLSSLVLVDEVLISSVFTERATSRPEGGEAYAMDRWRALGMRVTEIGLGDEVALDSASIRIHAPTDAVFDAETNDRSLVAVVEHPSISRGLLLTGDIQRDGIGALSPLGDIAVMELPHHGSHNPHSEEMVLRLRPDVVLQSTGPRRLGDERWDETKSEIDAWYVTASDGSAWAEMLPDGSVRSGTHVRR